MITIVGRVNKIFGTEGGVMVSLYTTFPDDFDKSQPFLFEIDGLTVPVYCDRLEKRGHSGATASFADFDSERRASELLGKEFSMEFEYVEDDSDEFFMEDLVGFTAIVDEREGTLSNYYDSDANPLFGVTIDGVEVLIPAAEEFIAGIDFKKAIIKIIPPEGLVELQTEGKK